MQSAGSPAKLITAGGQTRLCFFLKMLGQEDANTDVQVVLWINAKRTLRIHLITFCSGDSKKENPPLNNELGEPLQ